MQEAHIRLVRVGEFAWSTLEPGRDTTIWTGWSAPLTLPRNMASTGRLGTPTAAPPAWLTRNIRTRCA